MKTKQQLRIGEKMSSINSSASLVLIQEQIEFFAKMVKKSPTQENRESLKFYQDWLADLT